MSVHDEYGRHAYEGERDDDGNLKTDGDYRPEDTGTDRGTDREAGLDSDGVVQGETLLPVDSDGDREDERLDGTVEGEPLPGDTYGQPGEATYGEPRDTGYLSDSDSDPDAAASGTLEERAVTYDSVTGEPVEAGSGEVVADGYPADTYPDDTVGDGSLTDEPVGAGDETSDAAVADDVVTDEPVVAAPVDGVSDTGADAGTDTVTDTAADEPSWQDLKGLFVDDPAGAVAGAASKVDAAIAALRDRGAGDSDTEHLRLAFRRYQDIHRSLTES